MPGFKIAMFEMIIDSFHMGIENAFGFTAI